MKKIIDWLNWNVRINFIDNVWWPLFGKEEKPTIKMTGENLKAHRKRFGLSPSQMADMFYVSRAEYLQFEKVGLLGPHDTQGPISRMVLLISFVLDERAEYKKMLDTLGYKGKM